jgi:ketosteroid isomerase-like protein
MKLTLFVISAILYAGVPAATVAADPAATAPDSPALVAFKKAIRQKYDMKEKAFAAHDAETILTRFYAEDAVYVGAGFGIFNGRKDLWPAYEKAVNEYTVKVTSVHTFVKGNAGWDWADFYATPVDPKEKPFNLVILFLWAKTGNEWMCKGDFYVQGSFKTGKLTAAPQ